VQRIRRRMGRRTVIVTLLLLLGGGGGLAWALWSANGSGSGQAKALTAQTITVGAATATADLYPGGPAGAVSFTLTNPNPYPVTLTSMTPGSITSSDPVNCPVTNVAAVAKTGLALNVGASATTGGLTIPGVMSMVAAAPDGCQGVTFTVSLSLTGSQV
jgi:hypothetical protein